jgi:hypothetical protein
MSDSILDNRHRIRQRLDSTALPKSAVVSSTVTSSLVKLDVVASKVTITVPSVVTVTLNGSIDGSNFFEIEENATNETYTYGTSADNHLVKYIQVVWVSGAGAVTIAA